MQGQRGQDFETAARGRHSFRFLGPRPNDRLSHPVKEAAYRAAIHLNPQRGVERLAHFLQAALGIALMRAPQERLRLGGEFATISLTPPVQETGEALGRQAGLVTKILWPTKGHRVSAEKLVHGQIGSSDLFYHRCDLLGSAFPAGRGPVHPPQHSLNMAIWPACSAVFVRSWGIKRYNWTMLFRGEDSSSSWLLIISSTDSFLRARESRSYVELRSGPVSANCNSPKYQTIVMYYNIYSYWNFAQPSSPGYITPFSFTLSDASVGTPCTGAPPYSATATATDGSGVTISATAQPSATIYYPSGNTLSPSLYWGGNPTTLTDTNGNQISGTVPSNRIITDTLGTTAITAQGQGTPSSPVTFQYTNAAG